MSFATQILCIIIGIYSFGNEVFANIRGTAGVDYPNYSSIPITSFKCSDQHETGFYADPETRCQVFHYCYENRQETFLCPIGTTFNQAIKSCDYWYSSECDSTEIPHNLPVHQYIFNDQPFVPVTSSPSNVFEKMVALHDSRENLYKKDDTSVFQFEPSFENGEDFADEGHDRRHLSKSLSNLDEISQSGEQDHNFVVYDHGSINDEDVEIIFPKDGDFKSLQNNPNFFAETYKHKDEEHDSFQQSFDSDKTFQRLYQKEYSSDEQIKEMPHVDLNSLDKNASNFGLNLDSTLHKRFSEMESKKRKIRRKPKYVVLQTNFVENPESQKVDLEHKSEGSPKNTLMVKYADGMDTTDYNENAADILKLEYGKLKRNRRPLRKDYTHFLDQGNVVVEREAENLATDMNRSDGFSESSESQSDLIRRVDDSDEIEISSDLINPTSGFNSEDMYEIENTNINADKENDNSELHAENSNYNNIFALNGANFLGNQQFDMEEPLEVEELNLESDTVSLDEINQILASNNYTSYEEHWSSEDDFKPQHNEGSFEVDASDSNLGDTFRSENSESFSLNKINANSEFYSENFDSKEINKLNQVNFVENQSLNPDEPTKLGKSHLVTLSYDEINELLLGSNEHKYQLHKLPNSGESDFVKEENLDPYNPFSNSEIGETFVEDLDLNEFSDSLTRDSTEKEMLNILDKNIATDEELEDNQDDQTYLEAAKEDVTGNVNVNLESKNIVQLHENHSIEETNMEFEREGKPNGRVNSKYLSFDGPNFKHPGLNKIVEDFEDDRLHGEEGQARKNPEDTQTDAEINVDSLEYFESEGQGYFMDELGRIYIVSGETGDSETLIYVGDIDTEGNFYSDLQDMSNPQTESSLQEAAPTREDSDFSTELEIPDEVDFNSIVSKGNEEAIEPQDVEELAEDSYESDLDVDDDLGLAKNSFHQQENSVSDNLQDIETLEEHTVMLPTLEQTDAVQSNLNQINITAGDPTFTTEHFLKDKNLFPPEVEKQPQIKDKDMNVLEIPEDKSDEMPQGSNNPKDSWFHLSSIPLPANAYEKGLYDEKVKSAKKDFSTVSSNVYPSSFYKELKAFPIKNINNQVNLKTVRGGSQTAEILNIKTGLLRNVKSDLASDEAKSAVAEAGLPSKIIDNLLSFSNPFQSGQENVLDYFSLHSPKFRNMPHYSTRTGKMFKPAKFFKLINFGKKLLKAKRAKLNSLKEYFSSSK